MIAEGPPDPVAPIRKPVGAGRGSHVPCRTRDRSSGDDGYMVAHDGHALLDFGDGRRLDAFGALLMDRPAPGATEAPRAPERWAGSTVYRRGAGWLGPDGSPVRDVAGEIRIADLVMEVRLAPSGQVGVFPEHAANVAWLAGAVRSRLAATGRTLGPPEVLNLFAYTGLATLAAARAGAVVVHVDASRPSVAAARRNAVSSGLADRPIRWIVDDAIAFVRREARRNRRYHGLVLDPPSYGHGGKAGQPAWRLDERIMELLDACAGIAAPDAFWLLTAHSPGWDPDRLAATLAAATDARPGEIEGLPLALVAESGAILRLGAAARFDPSHGVSR